MGARDRDRAILAADGEPPGRAHDGPIDQGGRRAEGRADGDLVDACRAAMRGAAFVYSGAQTALIRDFLRRARDGEPLRAQVLTPREQEVVKLIAESYGNRAIAETLVISEKTVERHRANILEKLGMRDRVELTRYAIRHGLIEP